MDIMELGAIGELVGGLAVIGSLIFVGLQLRQNNRLTRAEAIRSYTRELSHSVLTPMVDPATAHTLRQGLNDFRSLSKEEQILSHAQFTKIMHRAQTEFLLRREGLVQEEFAESRLGIDIGMIKSPGTAQWWEVARRGYVPAFVEYNDQIGANYQGSSMTEYYPWWGSDDPAAAGA